MYLSLSLSLSLSFSLTFFDQVMSHHHSDQMSQRSHVSRVTLLLCFSKGLSVSQSVSDKVTYWAVRLSSRELKKIHRGRFFQTQLPSGKSCNCLSGKTDIFFRVGWFLWNHPPCSHAYIWKQTGTIMHLLCIYVFWIFDILLIENVLMKVSQWGVWRRIQTWRSWDSSFNLCAHWAKGWDHLTWIWIRLKSHHRHMMMMMVIILLFIIMIIMTIIIQEEPFCTSCGELVPSPSLPSHQQLVCPNSRWWWSWYI